MTDWSVLVVTGLMTGLVTGLAALAVTLVFGIARFANAATGDVMTLAAYVALSVGGATGSLLLGGAAGILAAMLTGVAAYWLVFRKLAGRSAVTALLASIGVGFVIRSGLALVYGYQQQVFASRSPGPGAPGACVSCRSTPNSPAWRWPPWPLSSWCCTPPPWAAACAPSPTTRPSRKSPASRHAG